MAELMRGSILTSAVRDAADERPLGVFDVKRTIVNYPNIEILFIFL